jgi:hypothetical protein
VVSRKSFLKLFSLLLGLSFLLIIAKDVSAGWLLTSDGQLIFTPNVLGRKTEKTIPPGLEKKETPPAEKKPAKVKLEPKGYQLQVTLEDEDGEEIEVPEGTESAEFEIEEPEDKTTVKVRSLKNSYAVIRNKIAAQTHFPLMVNLETNELIVTTPAGQKVVTVLPDKAVENMLAANVIDQLRQRRLTLVRISSPNGHSLRNTHSRGDCISHPHSANSNRGRLAHP